MEKVLKQFLALPVLCFHARCLCIHSGVLPLSPSLFVWTPFHLAVAEHQSPLPCSTWTLVELELIQSLQRWNQSIAAVSYKGLLSWVLPWDPRNGPANLQPSCFTLSLTGPQPQVTCIAKGCLHTTRLNCFGCFQISVFALRFIFLIWCWLY